MGLLVDGVWTDQWYDTKKSGGKFERSASQFRNWITPDGSAGPTGEGGFKAEAGRYHLYVSYACPWAHRTLIYRKLKGLEDMIGLSAVHWYMAENGWTFEPEADGTVGDNLFHSRFAHEIYTRADSNYSGRVTVPILWDKERETIVSNESSEIIRMFNCAFDAIGASFGDFCPPDKRGKIDELNDRIYDTVNNGVYKCGFATSQQAYNDAVGPLFETMDFIEELLTKSRFLVGDQPTEADWRLFPTLYRFDAVYHGHFKCNKKQLMNYRNLWAYTRDLYQWEGIRETVNMEHVRKHYYCSHETINPHRILPVGADIDFEVPSGRK